jgi:hypothetical protein
MNDFSPHNDLETRLAQVHAGELDPVSFVRQLVDEQVFMPVEDETHNIKGFQRSAHAKPLVVADESGQQVLLVFTSPERAKPFLEDFPQYRGGLLVEFSWLLRRLAGGHNIALNPGFDIGMDFDAETVAELIANLPPDTTAVAS